MVAFSRQYSNTFLTIQGMHLWKASSESGFLSLYLLFIKRFLSV